jgi:hypothetical protein
MSLLILGKTGQQEIGLALEEGRWVKQLEDDP